MALYGISSLILSVPFGLLTPALSWHPLPWTSSHCSLRAHSTKLSPVLDWLANPSVTATQIDLSWTLLSRPPYIGTIANKTSLGHPCYIIASKLLWSILVRSNTSGQTLIASKSLTCHSKGCVIYKVVWVRYQGCIAAHYTVRVPVCPMQRALVARCMNNWADYWGPCCYGQLPYHYALS